MTAVQLDGENVVRIFGDDGHIVVPAPWTLRGSSLTSTIEVHRSGEAGPRAVEVTADADPWAIEADTVAHHLEARQARSPAMSWADSLGNLATLDRWRAAIGLTYDAERIDAPVKRLAPGSLVARTDAPMTYGEIAGVGKPLSRVVFGVDNQATMPHAAVMFDDFVERGGTVFDTAYTYMGGLSEQLLGRWVEDRGVRESVVILDKGGHTPYCDPESIRRQFAESIDRLRTDYVDIYMLHRDNADIPVGEFVDVLNEQRDAGRLRVYGVSNWSIERIEAANTYAAANGRAGIGAVSNNLSLARMIEPPWSGCVSSSGAEWRAWLERTQTPLMPWSSQARGFFTGRAAPDRRDDPELVRCWYSDDNFERLARVEQIAADRHVSPIVIALAWVLTQPFPTFPLIGPRTVDESRSSMQALTVSLTPEEVAWLNLDA
jgi:aryl-alcohol dehydrogenase-like predicted oxidoreductase